MSKPNCLQLYYIKIFFRQDLLDNQVVGDFYINLFLDGTIVVELKSAQDLAKEHEVQLVNYLNGLNKNIGLLINFGPSDVEVKRKFRQFEQKV